MLLYQTQVSYTTLPSNPPPDSPSIKTAVRHPLPNLVGHSTPARGIENMNLSHRVNLCGDLRTVLKYGLMWGEALPSFYKAVFGPIGVKRKHVLLYAKYMVMQHNYLGRIRSR